MNFSQKNPEMLCTNLSQQKLKFDTHSLVAEKILEVKNNIHTSMYRDEIYVYLRACVVCLVAWTYRELCKQKKCQSIHEVLQFQQSKGTL